MAENEKLNNVAVDNDVGTMEDVDAIMKKYDRESNTRIWEGTPRKILRILTALFGIFLIVMNMWIKMDERARRPLFLGLVIILVFIYVLLSVSAVPKPRLYSFLPCFSGCCRRHCCCFCSRCRHIAWESSFRRCRHFRRRRLQGALRETPSRMDVIREDGPLDESVLGR